MDPTIMHPPSPPLHTHKQRIKTGCDGAVNTTFHLFFFSFLSTLPLFNTQPPNPPKLLLFHTSKRKPTLFFFFFFFFFFLFHIMTSIIQSFQKRTFLPTTNQALPLSQAGSNDQQPSLRRRLSSLSLRIQPISSQTTSWAFTRSKSVSSMGEYAGTSIRKWWDWGWSWIMSRKPVFARDLEMNEEETMVLGSQNKGSWRHVFYKVRSEIRKLSGSNKVGLPQTFKYNSFDYSKNFEG